MRCVKNSQKIKVCHVNMKEFNIEKLKNNTMWGAGAKWSRGFSQCPGVKQCRGRRQCAGEKHVSLLLVVFTGRLLQERCGAGYFRSVQG